ncbi:carbamoyltransferase C-terminal domain-containing protein [sulfur-oxidizing endosymbiont of Gigantopelta aegis]|uniref:carbamoyltransferase C-terminal domain-containing protein n=1 Tax=sulfur-oxidizing endosymbiont of Gigantopelta aegis TaxID=2794934 RepID=UPI001FE84A8A|nr:carbamoyltransferase C-terminal domain-containing protein [sulfur-oxidizing endosymbiont of Gigantopelta aegis]
MDNSARIQTVHQDTNPRYYKIIKAFKDLTGCAVLINTSFNVRGGLLSQHQKMPFDF